MVVHPGNHKWMVRGFLENPSLSGQRYSTLGISFPANFPCKKIRILEWLNHQAIPPPNNNKLQSHQKKKQKKQIKLEDTSVFLQLTILVQHILSAQGRVIPCKKEITPPALKICSDASCTDPSFLFFRQQVMWSKAWRGLQVYLVILLMEEILHQLIGSSSHYLQGFIHFFHQQYGKKDEDWKFIRCLK